MILYIILFVIYFCFTSCLFHDKSIPTSENISDISTTITSKEPDFYEQVKTLMTSDIDMKPTSADRTITKPETLTYKELMKVPFKTIKALASELSLEIAGNKSQLCSKLKHYDITPEHIAKFQLA